MLVNVLKVKYPAVYAEYGKPNVLIPSPSSLNFVGEFIVGGVYKIEMDKEDFKYAARARISLLFILVVFIIDFIVVFN